jgi:hypothetical protein
MRILAVVEVLFVAGGIVLYIWRWQFIYPNFALFLLAFLIATFFVHRDGWADLGFGSHGLISGIKVIAGPTAAFAVFLVAIGLMTGAFSEWTWTPDKLAGLGRYFAWCLLQQFGLQSFFTNRLDEIFERSNPAAWISGLIFACFHMPNPVLIPVTFLGGYVLSQIFIKHRNVIPLALAQAIVGSLLALILPVSWHHGLRVGPGYYR